MIEHVYHAMIRDGRRWTYCGPTLCHPEAPYIEGSVAALPEALRVDYLNDVQGLRWHVETQNPVAAGRVELVHHGEAVRFCPDLKPMLSALAAEAVEERRQEHEEARRRCSLPEIKRRRQERPQEAQAEEAKPWRPVRRRRGL